jgi:hypothetical protein
MSGTAAATGRLVDPDGRPAAGVRLAVVRLGKAVWETAQSGEPDGQAARPPTGWPADVATNAGGEFRLDGLPAGEKLWLQVRDDRYALTTFPVTTGVAEPEPVTLAEPRLLTGRVTAADTGRPLPGARVAVIVGPDRRTFDYYTALAAAPEVAAAAPPAEVNGRTDADGRYRLRLPPGTAYAVYAYPPDDAAYLGWHWTLTWAEGETTRERTAALPPGVEVRGQVVEEDGRPIGGACVSWLRDVSGEPPAPAKPPVGNFPSSQADALMFSDTATVTGPDGRFRLVVSSKPVVLRVFGPTADYQLCDYGYERCPQCGKEHLRPGEHARVRMDPAAARPDSVRVTLRRGLTIAGRAIGPDGEPIREGVVVCRTIAQPLRKPAPRAMPIRDGHFELPGCVPGRVYPVLLLDAARGLAAVAELRAATQSGTPPAGEGTTVRLARCGTAAVRLVDREGRPLAGRRPGVWFWLADDRPAERDVAGNGPWSNPLDASWVDPRHYLSGPVSDADGMIALPALVPGLQYHATFADLGPRAVYTAPFRVAPGQAVRLPDVVAPPESEDEGHAKPQAEKGADAPARK